MIRTAPVLSAALAVAACAAGPGPNLPDRRVLRPVAEPSAVIAAELAFARMAREKGTWTAFRETATADAVWPSPQFRNVRESLKGQADPAQAIVWEPDMVWASCDGSFALSTGPASYPDGRRSRFATVWQRQNDGEYRWVLDQGFDLEPAYAKREMISARVADCPGGRSPLVRRVANARRGEAWGSGRSDDGTLAWTTELRADCSRTFTVSAMQGGAMTEVFRREGKAPPTPAEGAAPRC